MLNKKNIYVKHIVFTATSFCFECVYHSCSEMFKLIESRAAVQYEMWPSSRGSGIMWLRIESGTQHRYLQTLRQNGSILHSDAKFQYLKLKPNYFNYRFSSHFTRRVLSTFAFFMWLNYDILGGGKYQKLKETCTFIYQRNF